MIFEPGYSSDEADYDTDDSEELQYPVGPSSWKVWNKYNEETELAVKEAVLDKRDHLNTLTTFKIRLGPPTAPDTNTDVNRLTELLRITELENQAEDEERRKDFEKTTKQLQSSVDETIKHWQAEEDARARKQAQEEQRKIAEAQQEKLEKEKKAAEKVERERKETERLRLEKLEQEKKVQAERERSDAEEARRLKDEAEAEAEAQKKQKSPASDFKSWQKKLEDFRLNVMEPVSNDQQMKTFCHRARLKLNARVGQVTRSVSNIKQVSAGVKSILDEAREMDPKGLSLQWCLNSFCKAMVSQAETEVMVNPTAAYPLAFLIMTLFPSFPELLNLYLMRLYKACPWAIPHVAFDRELESGRTALGYERKADGHYESETAYMERQTGIFRLWAAMVSLDFKANPFPMTNGWKWIARMLNTQIGDHELVNIAYNLVATFLEMSGKTFTKQYGNQAMKMVRAIALWVGPDSKGGNATRLRTLVEDYVHEGRIGIEFAFEK